MGGIVLGVVDEVVGDWVYCISVVIVVLCLVVFTIFVFILTWVL